MTGHDTVLLLWDLYCYIAFSTIRHAILSVILVSQLWNVLVFMI